MMLILQGTIAIPEWAPFSNDDSDDSFDSAEFLRRNYSHYEKYLEKKASNIHEKTKQIIEEENQRESKLDNFLNFHDSWYDRDGNTLDLKPLPILVPLSKKNQYIFYLKFFWRNQIVWGYNE